MHISNIYKLFTKRRVFVFLAIVVIAFFVVFLLPNPPGKILSNLKFFQAALLGKPDIKTVRSSTSISFSESTVPKVPKAEESEEATLLSNDNKIDIQDQLDDIAEKIDLIQRQIADIELQIHPVIRQGAPSNDGANPNEQKLELEERNPEPQKEIQLAVKSTNQNIATGGGGGGGGASEARQEYPKILISEVQIAGENDEKEEFVELFNPNNTDLNSTGWYLQRKTKTGADYSSYASSTLFSEKIILAKNYFLICREDYNPGVSCDITTNSSLTEDNALVFKNPNREISDKLGFGNAQDFELLATVSPGTGQSIGRKWGGDTEQDTDNNFLDFELNTPTPKAKNTTYIAPIEPEPEPADTTPPEVYFTLDAVQSELNFTINFEITDPLDTVTPSGLASYIFRWQEGGEMACQAEALCEGWQEDLEQEILRAPSSQNFKGGREFEGESGKTYFFQITARDLLGNNSGWLPNQPALTTVSASDSAVVSPIIINEVQVAPIEQRFIELYNPNDDKIDLSGWYLQRKTKGAEDWASLISSSNFEGKTIPANGYFLISRELADSDILLSITLSNDNSLALKNSDREIIDKVGWGEAQDFETAATQNPLAGQSITRTSGADTDDNSADFMPFDTPTPGRS